jgi:hypothetical protein
MVIEVHEFLGDFWGFRSRRFVTMKPIKSLRLALALQYQGQDSFKGCHLKTLLQFKVLLLSALLVLSITVLAQMSVHPGIILPLLLNSILSSKPNRAEQVVTARLVQNSPLAEGFTSKTGNTIVGHTIELSATADAAGATTAYRFDEFAAYKKHSLIPISSRSVHSSKNAVVVQASQSRQGDCTPQETATTDPIVGCSVAVAEDLLRRFLGYHPTA